MAKFDDLTITNNGLDMIALSQSGAKLIFTKIKLGDGQIGDNDVMKLTDIINERMTSQISSIEAKGEGQVAIKFTVDNSELTSGFFVREIGIFAKINEGGEEKLYAYTNAGNYTNYLADNKTPIDAIITKIDLAIGNATDINFTVDKSIIYVSLEDLETNLQKHNSNIDSHTEAFTKHNDDENAHDNLIKKLFDLSEATLDSIKSKIKDWSKEVCLPLSGGTMKGNINANGYNITATKFIGNLQGKADSAANADLATKATQDSQGQAINTTYIKSITASNATLTLKKGNGTTSTVTINNVGNSTKATQDKNGKDITGYLYKTEDLTLNSNAEILAVGNISEILNSFCTKFKNIQGTASYGENSPTTLKSLNDNKAPKTSPAFSGTPTAPTAGVSVNNTQIATTAFAQALLKNKFTINKNSNGWWKDNNTGILIQWGTITASVESETYYMYGEATFPLTFGTVYNAIISHDGFAPTGNCINGLSNTKLKIKLGIFGVTPQNRPWNCRYIAIGLA